MQSQKLIIEKNLKWLNIQKEFSIQELKGHIIILNFWTYSSINSIDILSDIKYIEEKYKNEPIIIIGIHSPKFYNESIEQNLKIAINKYEIKYPIIMDNEHYMLQDYNIKSLPGIVVIDSEGNIRLKIEGKGKLGLLDDTIEMEIKKAKSKKTLTFKKLDIINDIFDKSSIFKFPSKLAINEDKNHLFISDSNNNRIIQLKIKINEKDITNKFKAEIVSIIGSNQQGLIDGDYKTARFNKLQGITFYQGNLYVCDAYNHCVREVNLREKDVRTIFTKNKLNFPWDCIGLNNNLYVVVAGSNQIWKIDIKSRKMELYAGTGFENIIDENIYNSSLAKPSGITTDGKNLYFVDSQSSSLRMCDVKNKKIYTIIGKNLFDFGFIDGEFKNALLQHPMGLYYSNNNIFIADTYNHSIRIAKMRENKIYTLICPSDNGFCSLNNKDSNAMPLNEPNDVIRSGNYLYIADTNNHMVRIYDIIENTIHNIEIRSRLRNL